MSDSFGKVEVESVLTFDSDDESVRGICGILTIYCKSFLRQAVEMTEEELNRELEGLKVAMLQIK